MSNIAFAQTASPTPSPSKKSSTKTTKAKPVDINSAAKEQLMEVPGIGDATAQKIIDGRPYKTKHDLVTKGILTQAQYDKMKEMLVAKGGKSTTTTSKGKGATATPSPSPKK
jgi:DNA uptake protein ComE-like DNA-binding protein